MRPLPLVILLSFMIARASVVTVDYLYGNLKEVDALEAGGVSYVSAAGLAGVFSGTHYWDIAKRKLMVHVQGTDFVFTENNPYFLRGDSVLGFQEPALVENGDLFVPLRAWADLLAPGRAAWDAQARLLRITDSGKVIRHASCEERKNGTLYTLFLPDSMTFDHTFFSPQLNLNVFKGKISVSDIEMENRVGLVEGISAVQFAGNAQIALKISSKACPPEVTYKGSPPRIEVTVRLPEPPKPAIPPPAVQPPAPAPVPAPVLPVPVADTVKQARKRGLKIKTIIIDPGHGGEDPGAINTSKKAVEKEMVLEIALKLKMEMQAAIPDASIIMTRDDDTFVPLKDRKVLANSRKGDLFISIHLNSIPGNLSKRASVDGYTVYFLDIARDDESRAAAALENASLKYEQEGEETGLTDIDFILKTTELNLYRNESEEFAILLEKEMDRRLKKVRKRNMGIGQAGFYVLRGPEMPAVLIECGFISNPREAGFMKGAEFQNSLVEAIAGAVRKLKDRFEEGR